MERKSHYTDLLFTITLFCIFAITALLVVLFGADIYGKTSTNMELNYTKRTALAYMGEKVRQNGYENGTEIGEVEGTQALVLHQELNEIVYSTYIFCDSGYLKEATLPADQTVSVQNGQAIMELKDIALEEVNENLLRITIMDTAQNEYSMMLQMRSK